jgi:hypothetical protein
MLHSAIDKRTKIQFNFQKRTYVLQDGKMEKWKDGKMEKIRLGELCDKAIRRWGEICGNT